MKNLFKISVLTIMTMFMVNCSNDDNNDGGGSPSNGWKIGSTNYTTSVTQRFSTGAVENAITAIDVTGGASDLNTVIIIFSEETGIAAGTYRIVSELSGMLPAADEIMISAGTNYNEETGLYGTSYYPVAGQTLNATVTITGGKAKIVIPQMNVTPIPVGSGTATTFVGTIVEP